MSAVAKRGAVVSYVIRKDFTALMPAEPMLAFQALQVLATEVHTSRTEIAQRSVPFPHHSAEQPEHPMPELVSPTMS